MLSTEQSLIKHAKATSYFLGFISSALFVYLLMALREILVPVVVAIFLTFLFHPVLMYFKKYKIPTWISLIVLIFVQIGIYYLLVLIIISSLSTLPDKMQLYVTNLTQIIESILVPFDLTLKEFAAMMNIDIQTLDFGKVLESLIKAGVIQGLLDSFYSMMGSFFIMMIFWIFMIMGKNQFEERLKVAFESNRHTVEKSIKAINNQLQSYIIIKTILSLLTGFITTVILLAYGIDFALIWGLLALTLNFIPNIGSIIATIAPIIIVFLEHGFGFTTISLAALLMVNQNVIGNIIEPQYLGRQMDLSPVFVLFSLIFWGWIWGVVGMFLAVPIAAAIKISFSNIEALRPIAILMGSKPHKLNNDIIHTP
ncbi:MAG: AI-2E family transporter [Ignavibacteriaceae bacterium]|nr:AI-2E family transporter [Ignavibacteriaceae bacterium]